MDSGEDARKKRQTKRDCREVVQPPTNDGKKLKKDASSDWGSPSEKLSASNAKTMASQDAIELHPKQSTRAERSSVQSTTGAATIGNGEDLESVLNRINEQEDEPLSKDSFLSFRLGHAGDASTLASWYRRKSLKTKTEPKRGQNGREDQDSKDHVSPDNAQTENTGVPTNDEQEASSSLELWIEKGLGNEDNPPYLFALLAEKRDDDSGKINNLVAVALLTLAWEEATRMLRVEWFHSTCPVVERRMWLRLATLSLMTACELLVVEQSTSVPTVES